jgi:hypothetical protein
MPKRKFLVIMGHLLRGTGGHCFLQYTRRTIFQVKPGLQLGNRVSKGEKIFKRVPKEKTEGSFAGGFKMFPL